MNKEVDAYRKEICHPENKFRFSLDIWTLDGDGELHLSLMATLAQEESRKVSERVKAGQHVSREKGTLYGSGNILGYDRVGDTYVLNPEQAETVRMIYDMYLYEGMGTGKIATRLTELGRLNASGVNKWAHGVVSRVLNNQTYMGVMAYGKSFSNNYLEQRQVNSFDHSTYMYVQGNFPAIVTEEEWHRVQEIKARLSKKLDSYVEMRSEGDISRELFRSKCAELEPRIKKL